MIFFWSISVIVITIIIVLIATLSRPGLGLAGAGLGLGWDMLTKNPVFSHVHEGVNKLHLGPFTDFLRYGEGVEEVRVISFSIINKSENLQR